jgi:hypothetical protein
MSRSFNTNVKYNNKIYHVQTEVYKDQMVTNVFDGGKVVFCMKNEYIDFKSSITQHKKVEFIVSQGKFKSND